jgi:parallel beta-helix repeat protein
MRMRRRWTRRRSHRLTVESLESRNLLANYFVSTTGNDGAAGTTAAPWKTLQHAADEVAAGDHVTVRAGTYSGFYLETSGTAAQRITFTGEPGAIINHRNATTPDGINLEGADYITIEGFKVVDIDRAGIRSVLNQHVTIRNNEADHNGRWGIFTGFSNDLLIENNIATRSIAEHGIYVSNSGDRPIIRGNIIHDNNANGIHMNGDASEGGDGTISGALVENNIIYNNGAAGGSGINGDGIQDSVIRNNLLYNNHASGISLYQIDGAEGAKNNLVVNNTVIVASDGRWAMNIQDGSTGNHVFNNIFYNNHPSRGSIDIDPAARSGFQSDSNVVIDRFTTDGGTNISLSAWRTQTGQDAHSIVVSAATVAALFANFAGNDYHLKTGSLALNAGTSASAPPTDFEGTPRPSGGGFDIGADELSSTDTTAPTVSSVRIRGSAWNAALASVALPAGGSSARLPWINLDTIEVAFSEAVQVDSGDLQLDGNLASYPIASFAYDAATFTARWRLATPLASDVLGIDLGGISDTAGNPLANYAGTTAVASPGDVNGDGAVNATDVSAMIPRQFTAIGNATYEPRCDVDGSGQTNIVDLVHVRDHQSAAPLGLAAKVLRARRSTLDVRSAKDQST